MQNQRQAYHSSPQQGESQFRGLPHRDPWLAALEVDFRDPADGRKWRSKCALKRQVVRGFRKLGPTATGRELSRFLGIPERTVKRGIALLVRQKFLSNGHAIYRVDQGVVRRVRIERQFHVERLGQFASAPAPVGRESGPLRKTNVALQKPPRPSHPAVSQDQWFGVRSFPQRADQEKEKIADRPLSEQEKEKVRIFLAQMEARKRWRERWA